MTRFVVVNEGKLFKGTTHNEIRLCVQIIDTVLSSNVDTIKKAHAIVKK